MGKENNVFRFDKTISEAGEAVNFAPYGKGILDEWIVAAEKRRRLFV